MQTTKIRINPLIEIIPEEKEMDFILESELDYKINGFIEAKKSHKINIQRIRNLKI